MRWHVISAVFSRNVKLYFSGVLGYLVLIAFVLCCAVMAFSRQFFADNLANLDQLSHGFPLLLLFFVPAISMSVWAEEKRSGTDAILFTLPASDLEILLGKYFALVAVYTIALVFSTTQLIALKMIGNPDWGVIIATYFGYWMAGLALLSVGMFASSLTSNSTVAFVLGSLFCAIPVLLFGPYFQGYINLEMLGIDWNMKDFTLGLVPLANVLYFLSIAILMLYLNLVVISRRHWSRGQQVLKGFHFVVRVMSIAVFLIALNYVISNVSSSLFTRLDLTSEKLYSLDDATRATLNKARSNQQPITLQAFISRDVPRKYVDTRKQFAGLLRQYEYYGGQTVEVRFVEVANNSTAEEQAQQLGVIPRNDRSDVGGRTIEQDVYLGALVSSPQGEVAIPFVDDQVSIEYELTHAIATSSDKDRKITLGIVDTDTFFAGPEFEGRRIPWAYETTLSHLKKQYNLKNIAADELPDYVPTPVDPAAENQPEKLKTPPDVLLVADPSSLSQPSLAALVQYMAAGHPTLLLADPMPFFWTSRSPTDIGVLNSPSQPRVAQFSPYAQILASSPDPKADQGKLNQVTELLGIEWDNGTVAWNLFNPHPSFKGSGMTGTTWPEYYGRFDSAFVFVRKHADHQPFAENSVISNGLNEVLFFYPGAIVPGSDAKTEFTPLITLEEESGLTTWDRLVYTPSTSVSGFDPNTGRATTTEQNARNQITAEDLIVLKPSSQTSLELDKQQHVLAAHIQGRDENKINVVFICDLDFVSDLFYEQQAEIGQQLDNSALLENAIDILAGHEEFVSLRNRRPTPRTLTQVEKRIEEFRTERTKKQEEIESNIREQLAEARSDLEKAAEKIEKDQSLSFFEKLQQTSQEASQAQRRFDIKKERLDKKLEMEIKRLETQEQQNVNRLENIIGLVSIGLAIFPALLLGSIVLIVKTVKEHSQVRPSRSAE
ncbi:MAG: Gldg family protein [Pirellulaceae bacterium]|nr:Gldg family protein [Pirellulaceae bacterium]